ncbi:hypothetical protein JCM10213_005933 [Rhodosporidiobolus nylandii]
MPSLLDLPDELLVQVIEDAVPTAMGSRKGYRERCRTLLAVILTSKRLHAVALPLLYRVLRLSEARFRSIMADYKDGDGLTYPLARSIICDGPFTGLAADLLSFAIDAAPSVSDLRIDCCQEFALLEIQPLSALTSLTLHDVFYNKALNPEHVQSLRLPHVVDLSLDYLSFTRTGCEAFLSSATFPSLQHLALNVVMLLDSHGPIEEVVPLISPALLVQLRTLRCWHTSHPSDFPFPDALRVLHNVSVGSLRPDQPSYASLPQFPHLALLPHLGASGDPNGIASTKGALREMAATLSRVTDGARLPLRLVVLDSDLLEPSDAIVELKAAMDAFLEACKAARVEVIVQEEQHGFEPLVSKRFIRWCKEKYGTE